MQVVKGLVENTLGSTPELGYFVSGSFGKSL